MIEGVLLGTALHHLIFYPLVLGFDIPVIFFLSLFFYIKFLPGTALVRHRPYLSWPFSGGLLLGSQNLTFSNESSIFSHFILKVKVGNFIQKEEDYFVRTQKDLWHYLWYSNKVWSIMKIESFTGKIYLKWFSVSCEAE